MSEVQSAGPVEHRGGGNMIDQPESIDGVASAIDSIINNGIEELSPVSGPVGLEDLSADALRGVLQRVQTYVAGIRPAQSEQVGEVYVDAGLVMVGDPCYTLPDDGSSRTEVARDWGTFVQKVVKEHSTAPFGHGMAVVVSSGYGDGRYPVYVVKNDDGRNSKLIVDFEPNN